MFQGLQHQQYLRIQSLSMDQEFINGCQHSLKSKLTISLTVEFLYNLWASKAAHCLYNGITVFTHVFIGLKPNPMAIQIQYTFYHLISQTYTSFTCHPWVQKFPNARFWVEKKGGKNLFHWVITGSCEYNMHNGALHALDLLRSLQYLTHFNIQNPPAGNG